MGNMPNKGNAAGRSIVAYANDKKPPAAAGGLRPSGSSRVICGAEIIPLPPKKGFRSGASRGLVAAGFDMPGSRFCHGPRDTETYS
jgi:hypothetical protein